MTDGLRKSHLRKAPQVGLSEVGLPDIYLKNCCLEKTVGGVGYILSGWNEKKAKALGCQNACMYQQVNGQDRANYCFAIGSLPVACGDF